MAACIDGTDLQTKISTRYAATLNCVTEITAQFMINYNNWYVPRVDATNGIPSIKTRWDGGTKAKVDDVISGLPPLINTINTTLGLFRETVSSMGNAATGIAAGLDCAVLREDFELVKNVVCMRTFNYLNLSFVLVSTTSYLLIVVIWLFVRGRKDNTNIPQP